MVTAQDRVGNPGPYSALRDWQASRTLEPRRGNGRQSGEELQILLRTTEVARRLQVSARTVLAWAQAGKLPSILTPGGHRRYPLQGVEEVLATMTGSELVSLDNGQGR